MFTAPVATARHPFGAIALYADVRAMAVTITTSIITIDGVTPTDARCG